MKRLLVPLCAVTGCNWVFGLEPGVPWDARPGETLPPGPRTTLVWAVATSDGMPIKQPGVPAVDPMLVYAPIGSEAARPQKPTILVGDDNGLMPAVYADDGSFEIPYPLRESPHRIIYTLPGEFVAHEVQWSLTNATITVPRTTRLDAPAVPSDSGYTITPPNNSNQYSAPSLYTSGVTTLNNADFEQNGAGEIRFRFANAKPLAGPLGAPQLAHGDWVLLTDWVTRTTEQSSVDGWALASVADLMAGQMTAPAPQPMWQTAPMNPDTTLSTAACPTANCIPNINSTGAANRLAGTLGALAGTPSTLLAYGVSPSTELPGFLPGVAPSYVERPLMMPFLESTSNDSMLVLNDPSDALAYKRVFFSRFANTRMVDGVALTSSLNTVTDQFTAGTVPYPAPLALNMRLGTHMIDASAGEGVPVPASSSLITLSFEQEVRAGVLPADDFIVTLYEITGTAMAPVRHYHVVQPGVKIDGSLLAVGSKYVFGITARSGYTEADRGNYATATYPFGSSTTFTRTFVIQ